MRGGLLQLLQLSGFDAAAAETGEQALRRLNATPSAFALILLDLFLPGTLSGWDVRARQLEVPALAAIPTVVITACELRADEKTLLRTDGWLEKPFRVDALLDVVRRFVVARPERRRGRCEPSSAAPQA